MIVEHVFHARLYRIATPKFPHFRESANIGRLFCTLLTVYSQSASINVTTIQINYKFYKIYPNDFNRRLRMRGHQGVKHKFIHWPFDENDENWAVRSVQMCLMDMRNCCGMS